ATNGPPIGQDTTTPVPSTLPAPGMDNVESVEPWSSDNPRGYNSHGVRITRNDGIVLSVIFGWGSYTSNRDTLGLTFEQALASAESVEVMAINDAGTFIWPDVIGWMSRDDLEQLVSTPDVVAWYEDRES